MNKETSYRPRPPSLLTTPAPASIVYPLAAVIGLLLATQSFGWNFFLGKAAYFSAGDAAQHVTGWWFFAQDTWHFPLLKTTRLNAPEGVSIAMTDSIPLMALILKPISAWLPANSHYFGMWVVSCFPMMAMSATFALRSLGRKSALAALIAASMVTACPILVMRIGHEALMAQWTILLMLGIYWRARARPEAFNFYWGIAIAIHMMALLIHPYLFAMCGAIQLALLFDDCKTRKRRWASLAHLGIWAMVTLATLWLMGYLTGSDSTLDGFGIYSLNLLAPFCAGTYLSCSWTANPYQVYEGFGYLGLGAILAVAIALVGHLIAAKRQLERPFWKKAPWLTALLIGLWIYALSNVVTFASHTLFTYSLNPVLDTLTDTFRASGRFFWPVAYAMMILALSWLLDPRRHGLFAAVCLPLLVVVQLTDTHAFRESVADITHDQAEPVLEAWQKSLPSITAIHVTPKFGCNAAIPADTYLFYQRLAARSKALLNTGYTARHAQSCDQTTHALPARLAPDTLYVALNTHEGAKGSLERAINKGLCASTPHGTVCKVGMTPERWRARSGPLTPITPIMHSTHGEQP